MTINTSYRKLLCDIENEVTVDINMSDNTLMYEVYAISKLTSHEYTFSEEVNICKCVSDIIRRLLLIPFENIVFISDAESYQHCYLIAYISENKYRTIIIQIACTDNMIDNLNTHIRDYFNSIILRTNTRTHSVYDSDKGIDYRTRIVNEHLLNTHIHDIINIFPEYCDYAFVSIEGHGYLHEDTEIKIVASYHIFYGIYLFYISNDFNMQDDMFNIALVLVDKHNNYIRRMKYPYECSSI